MPEDETPYEDLETPAEKTVSEARQGVLNIGEISLSYFYLLHRGGLTREEALALTLQMQAALIAGGKK